MIPLIHSNLYRLVRGHATWIGLGLIVVIGAAAVLVSAPMGVDSFPSNLTEGMGTFYLSAGLFSLICATIAALASTEDFATGFAKTLIDARPCVRSARYYASWLVTFGILCAAVLGVGALVTIGVIFGFGTGAPTLGDAGACALWFVLAWLSLLFYTALTAMVGWLTRSRTLAVAAAILLASGFVESMIGSVISAFLSLTSAGADLSAIVLATVDISAPLDPALSPTGVALTHVMRWLPLASTTILGSGAAALQLGTTPLSLDLAWLHALVTFGIGCAIVAGVSIGVAPRRNV